MFNFSGGDKECFRLRHETNKNIAVCVIPTLGPHRGCGRAQSRPGQILGEDGWQQEEPPFPQDVPASSDRPEGRDQLHGADGAEAGQSGSGPKPAGAGRAGCQDRGGEVASQPGRTGQVAGQAGVGTGGVAAHTGVRNTGHIPSSPHTGEASGGPVVGQAAVHVWPGSR